MKKYKIKEVQEIFNIARGTIYNWAKDDKLQIVKEGRKTFVILSNELEELKNKSNNNSNIDYNEIVEMIKENNKLLLEEIKNLKAENKNINEITEYANNKNINHYKTKYLEAKSKISELEDKIRILEIENELSKINKNLENKINILDKNILELVENIKIIAEELSKEKPNKSLFKKIFSKD